MVNFEKTVVNKNSLIDASNLNEREAINFTEQGLNFAFKVQDIFSIGDLDGPSTAEFIISSLFLFTFDDPDTGESTFEFEYLTYNYSKCTFNEPGFSDIDNDTLS